MPQFELSEEERAAINTEVHNETTDIVQFLLGYMKDRAELFTPSDIRGSNCWDDFLSVERNMLTALCIYLGVSTEKCKERFMLANRMLNAMSAIRIKGYHKQ
jgi:hypothetical protein